jgi:hypothetical protein
MLLKCVHLFFAGPGNLTVNVMADGRVEISYHGINRSICHSGWDIQDARVICRMKGFDDAAYTTKVASQTSNSRSNDVWLLNATCQGNEKTIENCTNIKWNWKNKSCPDSYRAGVICKEGKNIICHIPMLQLRY